MYLLSERRRGKLKGCILRDSIYTPSGKANTRGMETRLMTDDCRGWEAGAGGEVNFKRAELGLFCYLINFLYRISVIVLMDLYFMESFWKILVQ